MEIKEKSREFNKVEMYLMTFGNGIISMKDVPDGTAIPVDGFLLFDDVKENTGEINEIMSIITPDKQVYSCQSKTFKRTLKDIHTIMDGEAYSIIKKSGTTKAGRTFITCELDVFNM